MVEEEVANAVILVGAKASVVFAYNSVGAVWLNNGTVIVDSEALNLWRSITILQIALSAVKQFCCIMENWLLMLMQTWTSATIPHFMEVLSYYEIQLLMWTQMQASNSTAIEVREEIKAVYFKFEIMYINSYNLVKFIDNAAHIQGGASFIATNALPYMIIGNYSKLLLLNNTAFQGGALYIIPSSFLITVADISQVFSL